MTKNHIGSRMYLDYAPSWEEALPGKGTVRPDWCLVGMAPSTKRPPERKLEPFGSKSWKILQQIVGAVGEDDFYITNLVKVPKEPGTKVTSREVKTWGPVLYEELKMIKPRRIICIGSDAAKVLCFGFKNMTEDHGTFFKNEHMPDTEWIIPTYHFSAVARSPELRTVLVRDLERAFTLDPEPPPPYTLCSKVSDIPHLFGHVIVDIETTGLLITDTITRIGIARGEDYWILLDPTPEDIGELGKRILQEANTVTGHNWAFDLFMLVSHDAAPNYSPWQYIRSMDTMLLAHNAGIYDRLSLKHLMSLVTDMPGSRGEGGTQDYGYLVSDLRGTQLLLDHHYEEYETFSGKLMCDASRVIGSMRARGVKIDLPKLAAISGEIYGQKLEVEQWLMNVADINWRTPKKVGQVLVDNGINLTELTKGGDFTVKEAALKPFEEDSELVAQVLHYRAVDKLLSGFVEPYLEQRTEYIYPSLMLHGTVTGRLSCSKPNLQQIPRIGPFKQIFVPRWEEGYYGLLDLDQAELRAAALVSGDEMMAKALLEEDVHVFISSLVYGIPKEQITSTQRKYTKRVTFGLLYGGSIKGLAKKFSLEETQVRQVYNSFLSVFPQLSEWIERTKRSAVDSDTIETLFGRKRNYEGVRFNEGVSGVQRKFLNCPMQSLASDLTLCNLRFCWNELVRRKMKTRPLFSVHDSMIFEIYPGEVEELHEVCQAGFEAFWSTPLRTLPLFESLPITGELVIGKNWAATESTAKMSEAKDSGTYYNPIGLYPCSSHGIS